MKLLGIEVDIRPSAHGIFFFNITGFYNLRR
jgi:hypothetical protein